MLLQKLTLFTYVYNCLMSEIRVWNKTSHFSKKKENCESWILENEGKNVTRLKRLTDTFLNYKHTYLMRINFNFKFFRRFTKSLFRRL